MTSDLSLITVKFQMVFPVNINLNGQTTVMM